MLRRNMTPDQVVTRAARPAGDPYVEIALRTGLRLEQITAKLQTLPLEMDVREFYELAKEPPAALHRRLPVARAGARRRPRGQPRCEGFLWPATYRVLPDTTPEELVRLMLDGFIAAVGDAKLKVPAERGLYVLPGAVARLDRRARSRARRGASAHRRRVPEPDRRHPGDQEQDPQRRPDGHLRATTPSQLASDRASIAGRSTSFWKLPEDVALARRPAAGGAARLPDLHPAWP